MNHDLTTATPTPCTDDGAEEAKASTPARPRAPSLPPLPWSPSPFHPIRRLLLETTQDLLQRRRR
jgi:hypothetical protein